MEEENANGHETTEARDVRQPIEGIGQGETRNAVTPPIPLETVVRSRRGGTHQAKKSDNMGGTATGTRASLRTKVILALPIVLLVAVIAASLTIIPRNHVAIAADASELTPVWTAKVQDAWKWRGSSAASSVLVVDVSISTHDSSDGLTVADVIGSITATQRGSALSPVAIGSDVLPESVSGTQDPNAKVSAGCASDSIHSDDTQTVRIAFSLGDSISDVHLEAQVPPTDGRNVTVDAFCGDDGLVRTGTLAIRGTLAESYR